MSSSCFIGFRHLETLVEHEEQSLPVPPFIKHRLIIQNTLGRTLPFNTCFELGGRASRLQIPLEHGKSKSKSRR